MSPPRSSVYFTEQEAQHARSAYLLDYDHVTDPHTSFPEWLTGAVMEFASLGVDERSTIRARLGAADPHTPRSEKLRYDDEVSTATLDAIRADRVAGAGSASKTEFFRTAVRWQSAQALQRSGHSDFPPPPARLPKLI